LLGGWALLGWLFLAGIPYQNIRFALLMSPPLAALAGAGCGWLWEKLGRRRVGQAAIAALSAAALVWMLAVSLPRVQSFLTAQQADKQAVTWAAQALPPGATVYSSGLTIALQATTRLDARELYGLDPDALIAEAQRGEYVLVNRWQIENQWANTPLQAAVHRLEAERGLQIVGRHGYYTLYRIGR
jgi:asparagine N-glycosylation enzyme membrane subunit Stt3